MRMNDDRSKKNKKRQNVKEIFISSLSVLGQKKSGSGKTFEVLLLGSLWRRCGLLMTRNSSSSSESN